MMAPAMTAALRLLAAAATASAVSLASFDLDVASGLLTLSFDATVQSATLNISAVALQSNLTSAEERYRLTGITEDVFPASNSSSVVSVAMAEDDLLAVLFRRHLAVSEESTWLTLQPDSIRAVSGALADGQLRPVKVDDFTADDMQPSLEAFVSAPTYMTGAPSMTESPSYVPSLAPTYDTPVPTLNGTGHWDVCANYTSVYDSLWINVSMGATNANAIKSAYPLGSQESLTYLALSDALAEDLAGNGALTQFWSIYEGQQAVEWTGDVTPPELVSFALDMDEGLLDLTFSETVNAYQFDVTCVGLQERTDNRTGGLSHDLWGTPYRGTLVTSDDAATLTLTLSADDLNEIKRVSRLAVERGHDGVRFDETVNASSLDIDRLSVQSTERDESTTERIALSSVATLGEDRGTARVGRVGERVRRHRRARAAMKLATSFGNGADSTFFAALSGAVSDMAGNLLQEVPTSKGVAAGYGVVADSTPPTLDAFVLDLDGGALSLAFDEPVTRLSLDLTKIVLSADEDEDAEAVRLSGDGAAFADAHTAVYRSGLSLLRLAYEPLATAHGAEVLTVRLGSADVNAVKLRESLGTAAATTLLSGDDAWVADSATGNDAAALDFEAASNFTGDGTPPEVERAVLDLGGGILTIVADEPVRGVGERVELPAHGPRRRLRRGRGRRRAHGPRARRDGRHDGFDVDCSTLDLLKIWGPWRAFLSHKVELWQVGGGLVDMYGNGLRPINGSRNNSAPVASSPTEPRRRSLCGIQIFNPTSMSLVGFDLESAGDYNITLRFDEPVASNTLDRSAWYLQRKTQDAYDEADATSAVTLTTNSAPSAACALVVALDGLDTSKIKSGAPLGQTRNQTFCAVRSAAAADCGAGRARRQRQRRASRRGPWRSAWRPAVSSFSLDLDKNDIVLEFDEPVNVSSVEPVERSLLLSSGQSLCQSADATALALGCSTVAASSSTYNETVRVSLCADDTDALMALGGLCRSESSCYLSHGYALAEDAAAPPNVARSLAVEYALEASAILPDVTPPTLDSFELDLDAGLLTLTFDEVVSKTKKIMYLLFDEPVDHEAANLSLIAIADSEDRAETLYLDGADLAVEILDPAEEDNAEAPADALAPYSTTLSIYLGNAYATLPISDQDSTYVKLDDGAVADVALANPNALRGDATVAGDYAGTGGARCTQLGPALEAFALDMDAPATLTLQFTDGVAAYDADSGAADEPVAAVTLSDSVAYAAAGLEDADARLLASQLLARRHGGLSDDGDRVVRVLLSETDAWKLQRAGQGLAKKSGATFISTTTNLGTLDSDTSRVGDPNYVVAAAGDRALALSASTFDRDATAPSLTNYTLDLDSGLLELHFDEPVKYRELNLSSLSLKTAQVQPYTAVSLRDSSTVLLSDPRGLYDACDDAAGNTSEACTYARVRLSDRDFDDVRAAAVGAWMDVDRTAAADASGNRVAKTEDATSSPSIPAGALSLNVTRITLRSSPQVSAAPITHPSSPPSPLPRRRRGDAVGDAVRGPLDAPDVRAVEPADALPDLRHAVAHGGPVPAPSPSPTMTAAPTGGPSVPPTPAPSPTPTPAPTSVPTSPPSALPSPAPTLGMEFELKLATTFQTYPGVKALTIRLLRDLADLKQTIASNPFIDGIGQSVDSTFLEATVGYVTDMAFPGASNDAPAVFSLQAAEIRMDTTGPRLAGYDYLEGTAVYLYFNEPLSGTGFNVSTLLFRADANATAAPVKLTDSTLLLDNDCVVKIAVSATDAAALSGAGVARGAVFLQHLGGFADGVILDMSENKLYIRYYHDVDENNINVTAVVVAASDSADAWSYRLTNATSEMYVAYDGKGEGVVQINLGAADVAALKLAGGAGVALGTTVYNTMVGLDASFIRSVHGRPGIPRVLGDAKLGGVKTFQMVPDNANPTVTRCGVDMDLGVLTIELDEPVRASEAEVTYITVSQTAAGGASFTLTSATARGRQARRRRSRSTSAADLDELKRLDHLAMNASTTHVSWLSYTLLDRGALANPLLESGEGMRVASYVADETDPVLGSYDVDLQARTMTLHFDEPVRVASFNASCLRLQESTLADEGQSYALFDSYAVGDSGADAVSVLDLDVEVGDDDYDAINDLSRLAKDIDSLRLVAAPCAAADAAGNPLTEIVDGTPLAPSTFAADATAPELLRFSVDMDRGTLTLNFTETVRFGSLDATKLEFYSTDDVDGGGDAVALSDSTTEASLEQFDDAYSTDDDAWYDDGYYGAANLASFDLDMDAGTLDLEFSEAVDVGTLTFELLALSTDGYATGGVVLAAAEAATRGDGKLAAQVARVGTDGDSAWLAAAAGAVDDMDGLPLVRIAPLDVSGGAPLQASRVVADDTVPVLLRVGFDAPDLILLYDEPVDIDASTSSPPRAVKDFAANSADNSGVVALTDPECACASGTYITTPCTSRADAVCATCSTACQADYYIVSECGEYVDVGCEPCVSCGYPYYDAGGCSGSSDRWWRQANCCEDDDGVQVPCNEQTESDVRIGKRNSRQHWVFDVLPEVEEGYEQGDATTL
ncbi:hypothetical protein JL722_12293 [Aureococcus anophagefferens]|nr:hypothetical protein JL722_12293 [Aureococcus anophagefferens]